jgi:uncharacterized protein YjgD (DUF1641 family)
MNKNTDLNKGGGQSPLELDEKTQNRYREILKDYDDYQSSIRHEGNPGNRLYLWKELCEGYSMTSDEFSEELKKAQKWQEKQDENKDEDKELADFVKGLQEWGKLDEDKKKQVISYIYNELDRDDIEDWVIDNCGSLERILANKTILLRQMNCWDSFDEMSEIREWLNERWIEEECPDGEDDDCEKEYLDWSEEDNPDSLYLISTDEKEKLAQFKDIRKAIVRDISDDLKSILYGRFVAEIKSLVEEAENEN